METPIRRILILPAFAISFSACAQSQTPLSPTSARPSPTSPLPTETIAPCATTSPTLEPSAMQVTTPSLAGYRSGLPHRGPHLSGRLPLGYGLPRDEYGLYHHRSEGLFDGFVWHPAGLQ